MGSSASSKLLSLQRLALEEHLLVEPVMRQPFSNSVEFV
jgi:hypothetical protein